HDSIGTEESLAAISVADLKKFHRKYYVAHNAVVAIVGDVDATQAMVLANQLVDELPAGEAANKLPAVPVAEKAVVNTEFPSSQTHIYLGQAGMTRHDPDYFPLYVGNHVLGGSGLVSLLGEEVRNKRGLSYSVYSYFSPMRVEGPFIMVAQTKNQQADQALGVMRDTLQTFIDNGPSDEELGAAVLNITGSFPLSVSSNSKIVNYIAMMGFYDYPMDWLDTLTEKVSAVTREQIQDAFKRRVDPEKLTAVVVGGE
ncbi:MAG: M16 family metallopeptidase, partial [bacterium]